MTQSPEVAIIGAGPYGLSIAAHLRARGVQFRIFGTPMATWRTQMPAGMLLKSEGFATDLYDPERRFTLKRFCAEHGLPYADTGLPIRLETMVAYGLHFQQQVVPEVENKLVVSVDRLPEGFHVQLDNGETFTARRVISAVGPSHFKHVPSRLAHLPAGYLTHSCEHHDLSPYRGLDVTVVGGGASALDLAYLLAEAGARPRVVIRNKEAVFLNKPMARTLWNRMRYPLSGLGAGWPNYFLAEAPMLFQRLPQDVRVRTMKTFLGPSGGWFLKDQIIGRVPFLLSQEPRQAEVRDGRVHLHLNGHGPHSEVVTDHVIAATGYRVDVQRLGFLSEEIRSSLRRVESAPALSSNFESSVPGLYFVGLASVFCFGPVMRHVCGARYTARRLSEQFSHFNLS
jgi:hypothetical protein